MVYDGIDEFGRGVVDRQGLWLRCLSEEMRFLLCGAGNRDTRCEEQKLHRSIHSICRSIKYAKSIQTKYRCFEPGSSHIHSCDIL